MPSVSQMTFGTLESEAGTVGQRWAGREEGQESAHDEAGSE